MIGRPHGDLAVLWRKTLGVLKYTNESNRIMGVKFEYDSHRLLILNVYMPYDDRCFGDNYECFMSHLGILQYIINECDTSCVYIVGDWNANVTNNSIFGNELITFCSGCYSILETCK